MRRYAPLLLTLLACGCGGHADSAHDPQGTTADTSLAATETPPLISEEVTPANTLAELLTQIESERAGLHDALGYGAQDDVQEHASAIGELVQGVPVMTPSVPLKRARRIDALVSAAAQHAGEIQQSSAASDDDGVQKGVTALDSTLAALERLCGNTEHGD